MFSKNPSKESLRQFLKSQCDNAMLLDNSVHQLYAAEPLPSKTPYRPRKPKADAYQQEIQRLAQARDTGVVAKLAVDACMAEATTDLDIQTLEQEAASFVRNRQRK